MLLNHFLLVLQPLVDNFYQRMLAFSSGDLPSHLLPHFVILPIVWLLVVFLLPLPFFSFHFLLIQDPIVMVHSSLRLPYPQSEFTLEFSNKIFKQSHPRLTALLTAFIKEAFPLSASSLSKCDFLCHILISSSNFCSDEVREFDGL